MGLGPKLLFGCVILLTTVAALWDWRWRRLPNALVLPALVGALAAHGLLGGAAGGWARAGSGLLFSLGGFVVGFGAMWILWRLGSGGGGDVKYMGAVGAWLGAEMTYFVLIGTTALVALTLLVHRVRTATKDESLNSHDEAEDNSEASPNSQEPHRLPFAVPVALATWGVLAVSRWW